MKFELVKGSLLQQKVEVVVVSTNNDLILGGGLSGEIRRTAGPTVLAECERIGTVPLGMIGVVPAGELPFKHFFLAAVKPIGLFADEKSVRNAIRNCFREASKREIRSIGFPVIGAGGGSFPVEKSVDILITEMIDHSRQPQHADLVVMAVTDEKVWEIVAPLIEARVPPEMRGVAPAPAPEIEPPSFGSA